MKKWIDKILKRFGYVKEVKYNNIIINTVPYKCVKYQVERSIYPHEKESLDNQIRYEKYMLIEELLTNIKDNIEYKVVSEVDNSTTISAKIFICKKEK